MDDTTAEAGDVIRDGIRRTDPVVRMQQALEHSEAMRELALRQPIDFFGVDIAVATLEDVMLSNLEWAKLGGSARQLDDVRTLLRIRRDTVDLMYLAHWITALGMQAQWDAASQR